jgi:very-short-patch-repair endonuclease
MTRFGVGTSSQCFRGPTSVPGMPTTRLPARLPRSIALAVTRRGAIAIPLVGEALERMVRLPGRRQLRTLLSPLRAGCHSELELWGYLYVFDVPGLRHARRQVLVRVGGRAFYLDMAYEEERFAVELDGRAHHGAPDQWERDIRRDLALATIGWQTIRLSHARLTRDVDGVRREVLAVLASRRQWRRSG